MALPLGTDVETIGQNASGGMTFGASTTELISFYGVSPTAQQSASSQATITASWATLSGGVGFGFDSSDAIISVIAQLKQIATVMKTIGLWKGSA